MVSKLAESTYHQWLAEGLHPTFQDIIDLNTVGVILERNGDSASFYCSPRIAFLGDLLLHEPTIEKRLYLDQAKQIIAEDDNSWLFLFAFVLNTPFDELPVLDNRRKLVGAVTQFANEHLRDKTYNQVLCAVDYAMNGCGDDQLDGDYGTAEEKKDAIELPDKCRSMATLLLNKAIGCRLDADGCKGLTIPQLDRVLAIAAMNNGVDVLKDEHAENTGRFYTVAGKIHARLESEAKDVK